jgi:hypothetical protein
VLPQYLKGLSQNPNLAIVPADSTTTSTITTTTTTTTISQDLTCDEMLQVSDDSTLTSASSDSFEVSLTSPGYSLATTSSRSSSPLSAVDIFTEFNTNVLQPMFDQVEANNQIMTTDSPTTFSTILVS